MSGLAALANFFSRILYNQWVSFPAAITLAFITGLITAFTLTKLFVFTKSTQSIHKSFFFFCLVNGVAFIQTWLITMTLSYYVLPLLKINFFNHEISHAIGIAAPVFTSYIGHKRWSFKD